MNTPQAVQAMESSVSGDSLEGAPVGDPVASLAGAARLVDAMVQSRMISPEDRRLSAEIARRQSISQVRALLDLGLVSEEALAETIANHLGFKRWDLEEEGHFPSDLVPIDFMRANCVLLFSDGGGEEGGSPGSRLVLSDPTDHCLVGSLLAQFGDSIVGIEIATTREIEQFLSALQRSGDEAVEEDHALDLSSELSTLRELASEAPVIRFFNQASERAMELGASDIHIERFDRRIAVRFRVDGVLVDQPPPPVNMYEALICRIKILANLDIAERRRAQDGRIQLRQRGRNIDMRISIVPTMYGQDAAIRLQDRQRLAAITLEELGFSAQHIGSLRAVSRKSHGILLITGPTGSGKTTTLYSLLRELASVERKVVTVEDPVEYAMDGVNQIQVNTAVGLTFSNTLRNVLRHDPDVILIGEIRDRETAEMAFQSALTGHMVLSTLHTNDVPSTFVRLIDMGIEPYLINAAVEGVSAQRLLRKTCPACKNLPPARDNCRACRSLGYRGRIAIMEYSGVNSAVKQLILEGAEEHRLRESLIAHQYQPMRIHAAALVEQGITDHAEVIRVLGHPDASAEVEA